MAESSIEWTDATWNPTTGCTRASEGCDHCYAFTMTKRLAAMGQEKYQGLVGNGHFNGVLRTHKDELAKPLHWRKPRMVFVNSMSDLFHKDVPFEFIDKVFAVMALCPRHTFQVLTKRPERMAEYANTFDVGRLSCAVQQFKPRVRVSDPYGTPWLADVVEPFRKHGGCLPNVWLGTSVENQRTANERIPHLLRCPAAVRFLSCEPLLGPVDLNETTGYWGGIGIHWVIAGGESGPHSRPCNVAWVRSLRDQCKAAGVPCFVKQLGAVPGFTLEDEERHGNAAPTYHHFDEASGLFIKAMKDPKGGDWEEWPSDLRVREFPAAATVSD